MTQTRDLALGRPDPNSRTVPVVLSTESPVNRGDYVEVLDHTSLASIDLSRAPLPLIQGHNQSQLPIGIVDNLRLDGRKLRGIARFGSSPQAQSAFQDVLDGVLRAVSIGYEYVGKPIQQGEDTLRFKFRPLEVSAVSVPADPAAGFYRNHPTMNLEENIEPITSMTRSQRRGAAAELNEQRTAVEQERQRASEITALCDMHKINSAQRDAMIHDGISLVQARQIVLEVLESRQMSTQAVAVDRAQVQFLPGLTQREQSRYSLLRAIRAAVDKDWKSAGFEREVSLEIARRTGRDTGGFFVAPDLLVPQRRDYNTLTGAAGGALVATNLLAASFIELLRAKSKVMQLGATVLSGLVGNADIPRRTAAGPAQWITEGQTLTSGAGALDVVSLRPKTVGSLATLSRNLLMQGTPDAEMLVRADMVQQLAIAIDAAAIAGTGTSGQPLGLLNIGGVGSITGGANGAAITFDHLISLSTVVAKANADSGALGFLSTPAVLGALSSLKATTGQYLWAGRGALGNETSAPAGAIPGSTAYGDVGFNILGYRAAFTNNVPSNLTKGTSAGVCSAVLFGNWANLLIGEWGVLEILPNPYATGVYEAGAVQIRALQTIDIAVRHAESFALMKDALTA